MRVMLVKLGLLAIVVGFSKGEVDPELGDGSTGVARPENDNDIQRMLARMLYKYDRRVSIWPFY